MVGTLGAGWIYIVSGLDVHQVQHPAVLAFVISTLSSGMVTIEMGRGFAL